MEIRASGDVMIGIRRDDIRDIRKELVESGQIPDTDPKARTTIERPKRYRRRHERLERDLKITKLASEMRARLGRAKR